MKFEGFSKEDIGKIQRKVLHEYKQADAHTSNWKQSVKNVGRDYLLAQPQQDKVKVRKVLNNLTIRLSTFVPDDIKVQVVSKDTAKGKEIAENCNNVFQDNFESMDLRTKYTEVVYDDGMTGVGCLAVNGWNEYKQEPRLSYIDSRLTFPDPKNWIGNNMRFFGTKLRKNVYELESDSAYDPITVRQCVKYEDVDIKEIDQDNAEIKDFNLTEKGEDQIDIYNHITIFKSKKDTKPCLYLTTWGNDIQKLLRLVKMRPLTDEEVADPSVIDFGVKLFRAKPLKGSYAGISIIDDIGQFQDIETLMTNLLIRQALEAGVGGRTYINTLLGIDDDDIANNTGPGSIIPFTPSESGITPQNGIYQEPTKPQNPVIDNTLSKLNMLSQLADPSGNPLSQGMSQSGSQTKAEIQTLQLNINQVMSYMASNYMQSIKSLWQSVYRSYQMHMSSQRIKEISIVNSKGEGYSYGYKKKDFISKGDVFIKVTSKSQQEIINNKDFAKILSVVSILKQSVQPGSVEDNRINRFILDKSNISDLKSEDLIYYSRDERIAYDNLDVLNNNLQLKTKPKQGENHNLYISIYKKGVQTDARDKAIKDREDMLILEGVQSENKVTEGAGTGGEARQLGASLLSQQQAQGETPSLGNVNV